MGLSWQPGLANQCLNGKCRTSPTGQQWYSPDYSGLSSWVIDSLCTVLGCNRQESLTLLFVFYNTGLSDNVRVSLALSKYAQDVSSTDEQEEGPLVLKCHSNEISLAP